MTVTPRVTTAGPSLSLRPFGTRKQPSPGRAKAKGKNLLLRAKARGSSFILPPSSLGLVDPRHAIAALLQQREHAAGAVQMQRAHRHEGPAFGEPRFHPLRHALVALVEQAFRVDLVHARVAPGAFLADALHGREVAREISLDDAPDPVPDAAAVLDRVPQERHLVGLREALKDGDLLLHALQLMDRLAL